MADVYTQGFGNEVRSFMMFVNLEEPLLTFLSAGDSLAESVFDEALYPNAEVVDMSMINLIKFVSTAFGLVYLEEAVDIIKAMKDDGIKRKSVRFRSRHPLFVEGHPDYQNVCLISGMIYMGIAIPGYFDGDQVLV